MTARPMVIDSFGRIPRRTGGMARRIEQRKRARRSGDMIPRTLRCSSHLVPSGSKRTPSQETAVPLSTVDKVIDELRQLVTRLDTLPDISDVDMALMYLRHLRRQQCEPVRQAA